MKKGLPYLAIAAGVLCMSTASIMIRYCTAPAMIIALYRVTLTAFIAGIVTAANRRGKTVVSQRDTIFMAGSGFFLALHFAFWITSLGHTSISSSVLFTNLQVVFVLLISVLVLKEPSNSWMIGGICIALLGSTLIAGGDLNHGRLCGDLLALASGFFMAVYLLIGRSVRSRVQAIQYMALVCFFSALALGLGTLAAGLPFAGYPWQDWMLFSLLAVGPGLAGHGVLNWALKFVKAPVVAVSILGESVGASILAFIIFGETLQWYQWLGGFCILTGIYVAAAHEGSSP